MLNAHAGRAEPSSRKALLVGAGCYLLFIVYGSLVPLDFNPRPLAAAWRDFLAVRYFVLGAESRADWIANGLLYLLLAYLLSAGLAATRASVAAHLLRTVAVFLTCAALAFVVEFTQLFFPPRTVSINDIVAELIGSAFGIVVWWVWGSALERLWNEMKRGGLVAIRAAVVVYVLAYLTLSLFPFDFYISAQEFSRKLASGSYGLLMASAGCGRLSICIGKLGAEIIAVVPLGVLLSMVLGKGVRRVYVTAAWCGLALGFAIEVAQLFIASGVSQGVSLLTRAAGLTIGAALHRHARLQWLVALQPKVVPIVLLASAPYLFALMWLNGWFGARWTNIDQVHANLQNLHWLPFYYHYYTTEQAALSSLLIYAVMYVPVGIGCWLWRFTRAGYTGNGMVIPAAIAAALALVMEAGKLFVPGKHPDPTNILIGAVAAALAYFFVNQLYRRSSEARSTPTDVEQPGAGPRSSSDSRHRFAPLATAGLLLAAVGIAVAFHPLPGPWIGIALTGYGFFIWRYPSCSLPAVLALLPLLNFSQWTGWVLLNEFDLLVGVTLAVHLLQLRTQPQHRSANKIGWIVALLAASFLISAAIGLFPVQAFDYDAISGYSSSYNSLRAVKGFLWAWALLPLLAQQEGQPGGVERGIVTGMALGLGAEALMVAWERFIFTGLFNFSNDYRAIGTFPELHTGGGDIHAYLVLAIPFAVAWILSRPSAARVAAGAVLFALGSYALAVTFTRGGYLGYFGAIAVLMIALTIHWARQRAWQVKRIAVAIVLAAAGLAVMIPIMIGPYMQSRLASAEADAGTRTRHWARAIDLMDTRWSTTLFGMGLGTYPRTFLVKARDDATATFSYKSEGGNSFVRLGSGKSLYFEQRVPVEAGKNYTLEVDLRSSRPNARLGAFVCEKSEQDSFQCKSLDLKAIAAGAKWQHQQVTFNSDVVGSALGRFQVRRPVFLSFSNSERGTVFDVDNVRLRDAGKRDLIANGDFARGGARWFFTADNHASWHIDNLGVQLLFDQGWLGVLALAAVLLVALIRLAGNVWRGDVFSGTLLAAICGFLLIALTESLFDGPRVTTLFFLLLFAALRRTNRGVRAPKGSMPARGA